MRIATIVFFGLFALSMYLGANEALFPGFAENMVGAAQLEQIEDMYERPLEGSLDHYVPMAGFCEQMIILHLVGLLLVVAVGSNYALFFDRTDIAPRTLASMLFANLTTVAGFGVLAFSDVSILQAMGATVAPGVILALIYAAIFARPARPAHA